MNDISDKKKKDLEKILSPWDRVGYAIGPAALTVAAIFLPELKDKYNEFSDKTKYVLKTATLAGAAVAGSTIAVTSIGGLYKSYKEHKMQREQNISMN